MLANLNINSWIITTKKGKLERITVAIRGKEEVPDIYIKWEQKISKKAI